MGGGARSVAVSCIVFLVLAAGVAAAPAPGLKVGFYASSCPAAEKIVKNVVRKYLDSDPGLGAGLVRMHFHDCFVRGCDASIMLKPTDENPTPERIHIVNNPSLRGWEVINEAKTQLEAHCPRKVSCADIIAFAARDTSYALGRIWYDVPSGRRDGHVSKAADVFTNLPLFFYSAEQIIFNFTQKGFTADEMVTLSGAHSLGRSHCTSFYTRLYNFNNTGYPDPTLNPAYAESLRRICPPNPAVNGHDPVAPLERVSPNKLDNAYYGELMKRRGLVTSDQTLYESPQTRGMVRYNAAHGKKWAEKYAKAMVKLGKVETLTGDLGEIRKKCEFVN